MEMSFFVHVLRPGLICDTMTMVIRGMVHYSGRGGVGEYGAWLCGLCSVESVRERVCV
jgi:hypothetical protein